MRILVLNPNTSCEMTEDFATTRTTAAGDVKLSYENVRYGAEFIESERDAVVAALAVCEYIQEHEHEYDAFVVACFDDPGVEAAQELTLKPVVGIAQGAVAMSTGCNRLGLLAVTDGAVEHMRRTLRRYSADAANGPAASIDIGVGGLAREPNADIIFERAKILVDRGADGLILGCAGFTSTAAALSSRMRVPVFDGIACAIALARSRIELASLGLWATRNEPQTLPFQPDLTPR